MNRVFSNFSYKKLKEKIIIIAHREGIEVKEVDPSYTSMIGALKYSPQFSLSRHVAAAIMIARRGFNFKEKVPKNYLEYFLSLQCEQRVRIPRTRPVTLVFGSKVNKGIKAIANNCIFIHFYEPGAAITMSLEITLLIYVIHDVLQEIKKNRMSQTL